MIFIFVKQLSGQQLVKSESESCERQSLKQRAFRRNKAIVDRSPGQDGDRPAGTVGSNRFITKKSGRQTSCGLATEKE